MKELDDIIGFCRTTGMNHPLIWLDRDGRIVRAEGEDLYLSEGSAVGKNIFNFLPEEAHDKLRTALEYFLREKITGDIILPAPQFCPYDWGLYFICPLKSQKRSAAALVILIDIGNLKNTVEELRSERVMLLEKNIALAEVLHRTEQDYKEFRSDLARNIEQNIIPALKRLIKKDGRVNRAQLRLLEINLANLVPLNDNIPEEYLKLSPREVEICNLIRIGATNKDIAAAMYISMSTVKKHREIIRRKLNIKHKKINLTSYLRQS